MITGFLLTLIFLAAALSLSSYLYCWHNIKSGRPHIITLRQLTAIMDRERLVRLFGQPEPGYYFVFTPAQLAQFIKRWQFYFYRETGADAICLIGVYRYMTAGAPPAVVWWFILLAGLCQGINFAWSLWLIRKWGWQIREEIEDGGHDL